MSTTSKPVTMTELAVPATSIPRGRPGVTLLAGLIRGAVLGVVARAWMRLIAEDPAFTWNGSLFIVIGFTLFGFTEAVVTVTYGRAVRRLPTVAARIVGVIGMLPLFVAAGAVMLPTVVAGGLAGARVEWPRWARALALVVAAVPVLLVGHDLVHASGWSLHALAGFVGLVALYAVIARTARPSLMRPPPAVRLPRWATITVAALMTVAFVVPLFGGGVA